MLASFTIPRTPIVPHLLVLAAIVAARAAQAANPPSPAMIDAVTRLVILATEAIDREVGA